MKLVKENKNIIYLIGIAIITFIRLTQDSTLFNFNHITITIIKVTASVFFGIKLLVQRYEKKELILIILLLLFSLVITVITKIEMTMLTVIILIGIKEVDIKKVVKVIFYMSVAVVSIHVTIYIFNYFLDSDSIKILLTKDLQKRHYVYFSHPNIFAGILFGIVLEWIYLYGGKTNRLIKYIVILFVAFFTYFATISRTNLILFMILFVGLIIMDWRNKYTNYIIIKAGKYSFTIITIITTLFLIFYNSYQLETVNKIDNMLSGRITLGLIARDRYGVTIFPQYIDFEEEVDLTYINKLVVDNFYMKYAMLNGCIFLAIMCLCVIKGSKRCDELENLYLFLFAIWGITEGVIFDISISIILLIIADKILNNKTVESKLINLDNNKNRVLIFGITENPGGVESVIMNYYKNINKERIQFDFLCNTEKVAYENEILQLGGKIYRITARSKNTKQYKQEMKKFFEEHAKEYSTIWVNVCSLANIDYLIYAKKYGIKYRIIHSHNSENMDSRIRGILHRINKFFIKRYATDFWACSEEAGKWFYNKKIRNNNYYRIINNAISVKKYMFNEEIRKQVREELNINQELVIGNVGRLHFQKNQIFLLDIFKEIQNIEKKSKLVLVGQGEDEEKLKEKVKEMNLQDNVIFLGVRYDVERMIQAFDSFVFPSVFEGLGLSLIEAEASGINVFASKDVIPELVKMSNNFYFISLEENAKYWATQIINKRNYNREEEAINTAKVIKNKGYDIVVETQKIEKYFERI